MESAFICFKVFGTRDEAKTRVSDTPSEIQQYEIMQRHVFSGIAVFP